MKTSATEEIALDGSRFLSSVGVVIPVWEPGSELVSLVRSLVEAGCGAILVVEAACKGRACFVSGARR